MPLTDDLLVLDDDRFTWLSDAASHATVAAGNDRLTISDKVDRWVTAPIAGPVIFLAVMWAVFQITTAVAAYVRDGNRRCRVRAWHRIRPSWWSGWPR